MATKKNRTSDPDIAIGLRANKKWSASKKVAVKNFLDHRITQRTPQQEQEISIMRIQFQMENE